MRKFDEQIIVVDRKTLFNDEKNHFNGFLDMNEQSFAEIQSTFNDYEVKRRGDMEEDPSYKQLISYALVESERGILVYERLSGGGEGRLHGLFSIGVGGHMNDIESMDNINEMMHENCVRELNEEIGLERNTEGELSVIGLINDDDNEVGRVHLGVVFKIRVNSSEVFPRESDTIKFDWVDHKSVSEVQPMESWSELIVKESQLFHQ